MSKIIKQKTKTLVTRENGRSSDAVSPNFIYGCLGGCMDTYCYVARYNNDKVYINENTEAILSSISNWVDNQPWPKTPNQCDEKYYVIDIGCSTDVALHTKYYDWQKVFTFFNEHPKLKSTFATKYPTKFPVDKYDINPEKNRIRVSLMPQIYSDVLEPNTDLICDRILSIKNLQHYMEVHINFSPIIFCMKDSYWTEEYASLFLLISSVYGDIPCECIFLTYSDIQKLRNSTSDPKINALLNIEGLQEYKKSQYGGTTIRYEHRFKAEIIKDFKDVYTEFFDINNIRYIF
jgi:spore photoproduct lyase